MKISLLELRNLIRRELVEAPITIKNPVTPEQKQSMIELVKWASAKMEVPDQMIQTAVEKATHNDDWSEITELLSDYCILKGIQFKRP